MEIDNGGSAYPYKDEDKYGPLYHKGMTLRDWFAGMAMQGLLSDGDIRWDNLNQVGVDAYAIADTMIYQRTAHKKEPGKV